MGPDSQVDKLSMAAGLQDERVTVHATNPRKKLPLVEIRRDGLNRNTSSGTIEYLPRRPNRAGLSTWL